MKSSSKMSGILKWKHPIFSSKEKHPETEKRNEAITLSASHKSFSASFIGYLMQKKDEMRQKDIDYVYLYNQEKIQESYASV
jgi:hypothetical protein